jgi:hypothetical protein
VGFRSAPGAATGPRPSPDIEKAAKATVPGAGCRQAGIAGACDHRAAGAGGKYVRTWLGTERGENGKTKVTLVWEPLAQPPVLRGAIRPQDASR